MYPFKDLQDNEVIDGILNYLENNADKDKDGILHLACGDGSFAKVLFDAGFKRYHGTTSNATEMAAAKKLVPGFKTRFHKMTKPLSSDALKHKHDIILTLGSIDFGAIPAGQKLIIVTKEENYDKVCMKLTPLFKPGASTIQHGDYFVTYGVRS